MLTIIRIVLAVLVAFLSVYGFFTSSYELLSYMMVALGFLMLVTGIDEFQKERRVSGYIIFGVAVFVFYVVIQDFLIS